jgi:hypothetical protein
MIGLRHNGVSDSYANYFEDHANLCFRADVNRDKKVDEKDIKMVETKVKENN